MDEGSEITLEEAVARAAWTHNTNVMISGYNPLTLMTGKIALYPGILTGNVATESLYGSNFSRWIFCQMNVTFSLTLSINCTKFYYGMIKSKILSDISF